MHTSNFRQGSKSCIVSHLRSIYHMYKISLLLLSYGNTTYWMTLTKQIGCMWQCISTVIQPHVNPIRQQHHAMTAAKFAVTRATVSRYFLSPSMISTSLSQRLSFPWSYGLYVHLKAFTITLQNKVKYSAEDTSQVESLCVPAMKDQQLVSYVPLPIKYRLSWVYLCHCMEYRLVVWKCWYFGSSYFQFQCSGY